MAQAIRLVVLSEGDGQRAGLGMHAQHVDR